MTIDAARPAIGANSPGSASIGESATTSEWYWEPDDFASLWYDAANDRFPRPLRYRSRFAYREEFESHREQVRARYSPDELEQIQLTVHTLATSDMRIEILGGTTRNGAGQPREYRIVGARNLHHAVVSAQSAGHGADGGLRVRLCHPEDLTIRIIDAIQPSERGSRPAATFHPQDVDQDRDVFADSTTAIASRERYQRLLGRPSTGGGSAGLLVGWILDRPDPWYALQWHDIAEDGRYIEQRTTDHVEVRPAGSRDLADRFATWIDDAVQRLRDDEGW